VSRPLPVPSAIMLALVASIHGIGARTKESRECSHLQA
jgi:hypothetical protein